MAKVRSVYVCASCGYESAKWNGRCPSCGEWNTFEEQEATVQAPVRQQKAYTGTTQTVDAISRITDIDAGGDVRYQTGIEEFDRVLGGGLVRGSLVLLGGDPGIGKSTLLLQVCGYLCQGHTVLYISGEESVRQIKLRADRLGVSTPNLYLVSETDAERIANTISSKQPEVVVIDSIQTMGLSAVSSMPGSITQVRECTNLFMRTAKASESAIFIVSHVNKDGVIAGPKVMEHIVDAVLYFEGDRNLSYRILRAVKNRYGSTNEIGVFEMGNSGLEAVENPSMMLLSGREVNVSGSCVSCVMEGTRPILAEVQALVTKTAFGNPRRMATGFDYNRMAIILAVIEKRCGFFLSNLDVYINVAGGLKLDEPSADLAVALAVYSGIRDVPIPDKLAAFGEIGLGGEIRHVSSVPDRVREAQRLGFDTCIVPAQSRKALGDLRSYEIEILPVSNLKQAFSQVSGRAEERR